jgi:hypothetical protein
MHLARLKSRRLRLADQSSQDGIHLMAATREPHNSHSSLPSCATDRDNRGVEKCFGFIKKALARGHGPLLSLRTELFDKDLNSAI